MFYSYLKINFEKEFVFRSFPFSIISVLKNNNVEKKILIKLNGRKRLGETESDCKLIVSTDVNYFNFDFRLEGST